MSMVGKLMGWFVSGIVFFIVFHYLNKMIKGGVSKHEKKTEP